MKILKFNEALLKGKGVDELSKGTVKTVELRDIIKSFGLRPMSISTEHGISKFSIDFIYNEYINVYYYDYDIVSKHFTPEALKDYSEGYHLSVNGKMVDLKDNTREVVINEILDIAYPNITNMLSNTTKKLDELRHDVENQEKLVNGIKKAIKYKDEN